MNFSAEVVYLLCTATSLLATYLLFRAYRRGGPRLLFWSAICFLGLCINNVLLFVDVIILPDVVDLSGWRSIPALIGVALLCYGLIEEST